MFAEKFLDVASVLCEGVSALSRTRSRKFSEMVTLRLVKESLLCHGPSYRRISERLFDAVSPAQCPPSAHLNAHLSAHLSAHLVFACVKKEYNVYTFILSYTECTKSL